MVWWWWTVFIFISREKKKRITWFPLCFLLFFFLFAKWNVRSNEMRNERNPSIDKSRIDRNLTVSALKSRKNPFNSTLHWNWMACTTVSFLSFSNIENSLPISSHHPPFQPIDSISFSAFLSLAIVQIGICHLIKYLPMDLNTEPKMNWMWILNGVFKSMEYRK